MVFVLGTAEFAAESVAEGSRTRASAARAGVEAKDVMVFDREPAVEEKKTWLDEMKKTAFFPGSAAFSLETAVMIPSSGISRMEMGTRISLIAVHNTERAVFVIKIDAPEINTGPISAETDLHAAFRPQRVREEPVGRCATAVRRCNAIASARAFDAPRSLHGSPGAKGVRVQWHFLKTVPLVSDAVSSKRGADPQTCRPVRKQLVARKLAVYR